MSDNKTKRRVAILLESTRAYSRSIVRGISQYNREEGHWHVEYTPRGLDDPPPGWLKHWKGDGILARINDCRLLEAIRETGLPAVDLCNLIEHPDIPQVGPNNRMIACELFDYFRRRGFTSFAFLCHRDSVWYPQGDKRLLEFRELVLGNDFRFSLLKSGTGRLRERFEISKQLRLRRWLQGLPSQTAIVASTDDLAFYALRECRNLGITVPEQLAIAGIGNDECFCELSVPTLTSLDLNAELIGYTAADILANMMNRTDQQFYDETRIPPKGVVARQSTDVIATTDERMTLAIRYIREQAHLGIAPKDVLRHVRLSRVALENRFKQTLGRTIHQEIIRVRLARVQELLTTTDLSFSEIAHQTGFAYPEYMMRVFRQETGYTLKTYRDRNKRSR